MEPEKIIEIGLKELKKLGAEQFELELNLAEKQEMNVHSGELKLFRTTVNNSLRISVLQEQKRGTIAVNKLDDDIIRQACREALEMARSSKPDEANAIAPRQPAATFTRGVLQPDADAMYTGLAGFVRDVKERFPRIILEEVIHDHTRNRSYFVNSNQVDYLTDRGFYTFVLVFTAREGKHTSSFNYTDLTTQSLEGKFLDRGSFSTLLAQSSEQIATRRLADKFVGDIIITPDCLGSFIGSITSYLRDMPLITGTSIYRDKLNQSVAVPGFTLRSEPLSNELEDGYFVTGDGFRAQDNVIIEEGILKSHLLTLYGANKTGRPRAANYGGNYIVDPGGKSLEDIIASTEKGILLSRFSGGNPSENGDFSGVAKNSYYIENGRIQYPVSELMVAGNLAAMLLAITDISRERINFGTHLFPWIKCANIHISG